MQFMVRELAAFELRYTDEYKKKFILPLDIEKNKGIAVDLDWGDLNDCWDTITGVCDLIADARVSMAIFNLAELFESVEETVAPPYSAPTTILKRTMLGKDGRAAARTIDELMTKRHYTRMLTGNPEEYVYVMLHSGLVY